MVEKRLLIIPHLSRLIIEGRYLRLCPSFSVTLAKTEIMYPKNVGALEGMNSA